MIIKKLPKNISKYTNLEKKEQLFSYSKHSATKRKKKKEQIIQKSG